MDESVVNLNLFCTPVRPGIVHFLMQTQFTRTLWSGNLWTDYVEIFKIHLRSPLDPEWIQTEALLVDALPPVYSVLIKLIMSFIIECREALDLSFSSLNQAWFGQSISGTKQLDLLYIIPELMIVSLKIKYSQGLIEMDSKILYPINHTFVPTPSWSTNHLNLLIFGEFEYGDFPVHIVKSDFGDYFERWNEVGTFLDMNATANRSLLNYKNNWSYELFMSFEETGCLCNDETIFIK